MSRAGIRVPAPPALGSPEYTAAFLDVAARGGDGVTTPTIRTPEQTEIGLFWAYDGTNDLGTPPVLYNRIVQSLARAQGNTLVENARLFAREFRWPPRHCLLDGNISTTSGAVVGIRMLRLTVPDTDAGVRLTRSRTKQQSGHDFTPPFRRSRARPFGAAMFRTLEHFTVLMHLCRLSLQMNGSNHRGAALIHSAMLIYYTHAAAVWSPQPYLSWAHWQFRCRRRDRPGTTIAESRLELCFNLPRPFPTYR